VFLCLFRHSQLHSMVTDAELSRCKRRTTLQLHCLHYCPFHNVMLYAFNCIHFTSNDQLQNCVKRELSLTRNHSSLVALAMRCNPHNRHIWRSLSLVSRAPRFPLYTYEDVQNGRMFGHKKHLTQDLKTHRYEQRYDVHTTSHENASVG
jgi:hypothetical protein